MDNGNDKQRIAAWRAKRRQERFEQGRERERTRQFGGHFFLEDGEGESIDPADAAADAEELIWAQQKLVRAEAAHRLTSSELRLALWSWDLDALRQLWGEREQKLTYLEDAARLLAHIRHRSGIDPVLRAPAQMMNNDAIQALRGTLEESGRLIPSSAPASLAPPDVEVDGKRVEQVLRVIRDGQADFRKRLIEHYGAVCMVTGTAHAAVIDAAHINPYNGTSTNALSNGLLLRKDIHALFDAGLLLVSPNLVITVSTVLSDACYRDLDGRSLRLLVPSRISTAALRSRMLGKAGDEIKLSGLTRENKHDSST
ncbi:HNH endonuclease [Stenotrophomonas sp. PA-6-5C]|uniref:HNH endonuclease n=1 Tax=Stenotrophomonas sp. PA-6-5C TaxID=2665487 RepID=UPI001F3768FE|nr:HNH endonuclease [Stenotrophomonas sp. PA-6-5C]MCF5092134.1 HNH endonuclease [Stenotrophomonas sp. PA-6-5C]